LSTFSRKSSPLHNTTLVSNYQHKAKCLPNGEFDHSLYFVPIPTAVLEPLQVDDEHLWQLPQVQFLGCSSEVFALRAIPAMQFMPFLGKGNAIVQATNTTKVFWGGVNPEVNPGKV
jgi:hypothetical protein